MTLCLQDRYPSLAFLLQYFPYTERPFSPCILKELPSLSGVEVLYLDGLEYLCLYELIAPWLSEDVERDLVIIEEDLSQLAAFLKEKEAEEILSHPQVHLAFLLEGKTREQLYEELGVEFPFQRIAVIGDQKMRLSLMRKLTLAEGLFTEDLCYHRIFENLRLNAGHFSEAYDGDRLDGVFKGIPAIICGAGPSLTEELPLLKQLRDRALIFAGGSTMTALSKGGVKPHLTFAIDPNPQEVERLKQAETFEVPLFYGGRLRPEVFDLLNGMKVYLRTHTGGPFELHMQETLGLGTRDWIPEFDGEALSVTTTCLSMAARMGCNPIILVGIDLAFTRGESYAAGVIPKAQIQLKELLKDKRASEGVFEYLSHHGEHVYTMTKWVMESRAIASFIKEKQEIQFINATRGGLGFEGVPFCPLASIPLEKSQDLEGLVHTYLMQTALHVLPDSLQQMWDSLKESLRRSLSMIDEMLADPKKSIYLSYDFEQEEAFAVLLFPIERAVARMMKRKYRNDINKQTEAKWNYLKSIIEHLLDIS